MLAKNEEFRLRAIKEFKEMFLDSVK